MKARKTLRILTGVVIVVLALIRFALADEDNWSTSGPHDASIYSIAIHPFDNQRIFIGTLENFVYETTDGGGEWSLLGDTLDGYPASTQVRVLKIHPFGPDTMFAATTRGLYESTDAGQNWFKIMSLPYPDVQYWSLEINRENPPVIFVGHMSGGFRSTDGGRSWEDMPEPPGQHRPIVADPVRPNIIYAGANTTIDDASIWKSTDSGITWENIHNNLQFDTDTSAFAVCIDVDPIDPEIVYFGRSCRYITNPPEALVKSTNGGEYWIDITPPDLHKNRIHGVTASPVDHNTVFASTHLNGLLRSLDGGLSWEEINQGIIGINPRAQTVAVDSVTGIIYLGRHSSGIYRSTDNGDSWEKISYNITGAQCEDIAANFRNPDTLYTVTRHNGLYMSTDGADSWEYIDISFPSICPRVNAVEVDPFDPSYVYLSYYFSIVSFPGSMALYRSTDGGASWESFTQGLPTDKLPVEISIADYGGGVRRLFMALSAGLYYSDDLGQSWARCGGGLPVTYFISLDVSPANPDLVFVGDASHNLYKSSDGGETWELLDSLPYDDRVRGIVCDPVDPDIVYMNMGSGYPGFHGIFKSADGGQSWYDITNNLPRSSYFYTSGIAINPYNNNNVFVYSSGRGIFQSSDGGQFWEDFNDGLRVDHGYAYTLIDPTDTSRVFMAMGRNSVWEITRTTGGGGDCVYTPGDCDHNGTPLELGDVIAMIGIYRGSVEPYYVCDCPPHGHTFAAEADPNGNCVPFELGDVVTEIGAYRGTAEASGCEDCPGSLRLLPGGEEMPLAKPSLKAKSKTKAGSSTH